MANNPENLDPDAAFVWWFNENSEKFPPELRMSDLMELKEVAEAKATETGKPFLEILSQALEQD